MNKIEWCLDQKRGIKIIEPNNNLSQQYVKSSEDNLDMMGRVVGKWKSITAYYACYEAFYALLQKIGISWKSEISRTPKIFDFRVKCEIHDCALELLNLIEGFDDKLKNFVIDLKKERIDVQYYLKSPKPLDENQVKDFVLSCKSKISSVTVDEIANIRDKIKLKKD